MCFSCWLECISLKISCLYQEKDLKVNQEASFAVQRNGVRGVIDAKVHAPSGVGEECYVTELDSGMLLSNDCIVTT